MVIQLRSDQNLSGASHLLYHVIFKDKRTVTFPISSNFVDSHFLYTISTQIPPIEDIYGPEHLFLWIHVADEFGKYVGNLPVGEFVYEPPDSGSSSVDRGSSRKGKGPAESSLRAFEPIERCLTQQFHATTQGQSSSGYRTVSSQPSQPSPGMADQGNLRLTSRSCGHSVRLGQAEADDQRMSGSRQKHEQADEQISRRKIPSSVSPRFAESGGGRWTDHQQTSTRSGQASPVAMANPPLIRTSTLQPSTGSQIGSLSPSQNFNPYSIYPNNRAVLNIEGDLDSMLEEWTEEEQSIRRRLVEFERSQSGNTIETSFKPVTLEQRAPGSICVSCIWWQERGEAFVTSVDTIHLLESLVAVRFTVEERNRIRRNLEGFRPLTVTKGKQESDDFFKQIMDFPDPRPRNIERDVKVFQWKILEHALKKIIGKYVSDRDSPVPLTVY